MVPRRNCARVKNSYTPALETLKGRKGVSTLFIMNKHRRLLIGGFALVAMVFLAHCGRGTESRDPSSASAGRSAEPTTQRIAFDCGNFQLARLHGRDLASLQASFQHNGRGLVDKAKAVYGWESFAVCGRYVYFLVRGEPDITSPATKVRVVASLELPALMGNAAIAHSCRRGNGDLELSLIALVDHDPKEKEFKPRMVWHIDASSEKFSEIDPKGIVCVNESYRATN